jgi:pyruvate/2-oxoglutarate dehydrogenase complex dihydrolipoamide acyltransferase (E2) component
VDGREFGREDGASRLLPVHDEERNGEVSMDVLMPQLGETVAEGKISKWFVKAGDAVKPGDNLFEIETDKVSMEVPAIAAGTLAAINVAAGEVAPVGAVVAVILAPGEKAAPPPPLIPAQAGIERPKALDPRLRGDERRSGLRLKLARQLRVQ